MRIDYTRLTAPLFFIALGGIAPALVVAQHVHGVIELGVVIEDDTIAVSLHAPMSDVAGFEHKPNSEEQVKKIQASASMLADPDAMFGLPESANCMGSDASVDGPDYVTRYLGEGGADKLAHSHDHGDAHRSHGGESGNEDRTESGAHDSHDDGDHGSHDDGDHGSHVDGDHDSHDDEEHTEVNAIYSWTCGDALELGVLELRFVAGFASVEKIEVQIITPAGARILTTDGWVSSIPLVSQ